MIECLLGKLTVLLFFHLGERFIDAAARYDVLQVLALLESLNLSLHLFIRFLLFNLGDLGLDLLVVVLDRLLPLSLHPLLLVQPLIVQLLEVFLLLLSFV